MAKKNANDEKILNLKAEIAKKKAALKASERFVPITNCSLELVPGVRQNINVLNKEQVLQTLCWLEACRQAASSLTLPALVYGGFKAEDWITDLQNKYAYLDHKDEQTRLRKLEAQLHNLLTTDTKVELELDELSKQI